MCPYNLVGLYFAGIYFARQHSIANSRWKAAAAVYVQVSVRNWDIIFFLSRKFFSGSLILWKKVANHTKLKNKRFFASPIYHACDMYVLLDCSKVRLMVLLFFAHSMWGLKNPWNTLRKNVMSLLYFLSSFQFLNWMKKSKLYYVKYMREPNDVINCTSSFAFDGVHSDGTFGSLFDKPLCLYNTHSSQNVSYSCIRCNVINGHDWMFVHFFAHIPALCGER